MTTDRHITPHYPHAQVCDVSVLFMCMHLYFLSSTVDSEAEAQFQPSVRLSEALMAGYSSALRLQTNVILHQTTRGGGTTCFIPSS